jgi:hypothetical protein
MRLLTAKQQHLLAVDQEDALVFVWNQKGLAEVVLLGVVFATAIPRMGS